MDDKKDLMTVLYKDIMPKVYGIGAAVVILGAMFKILNWPGANLMIGIGLTTEAMIFFLSSFEPPAKENDWTKVYPELAEETGSSAVSRPKKLGGISSQNLGYEKEVSDLSKTIKALNEAYSKEIKNINNHTEVSAKLFSANSKTLQDMLSASKDAEEFKKELATLKVKVASLNEVYSKTLSAMKG